MNEYTDRNICIYRFLKVHIILTITMFMLQEKQTINHLPFVKSIEIFSSYFSTNFISSVLLYIISFQNLYMSKKCSVILKLFKEFIPQVA